MNPATSRRISGSAALRTSGRKDAFPESTLRAVRRFKCATRMRASRTRLSLCARPRRAPPVPPPRASPRARRAARGWREERAAARLRPPPGTRGASTAQQPRQSRGGFALGAHGCHRPRAHQVSRGERAERARGLARQKHHLLVPLQVKVVHRAGDGRFAEENAHVALDTATDDDGKREGYAARALDHDHDERDGRPEHPGEGRGRANQRVHPRLHVPRGRKETAQREPERAAAARAEKDGGQEHAAGTARPYAAAIRTRYAHALRVNPIAVNPYVAIVACFPLSSPMLSILPITSAGLPNKTLATSLISPSPQRHRSPKSSAAQTAGRATHRPPRDEKRNRVNTVTTTTSTQSSTRATFFPCAE